MEKAKRVFAVLGLIWVIQILMYLIFPHTMGNWYVLGQNLWFLMTGARPFNGTMVSRVGLLAFSVMPACLIVLVLLKGVGVINKSRGQRLC